MAGGDVITTGDPNTYEIPLEKLIERTRSSSSSATNPFYSPTPDAVAKRPGWERHDRRQAATSGRSTTSRSPGPDPGFRSVFGRSPRPSGLTSPFRRRRSDDGGRRARARRRGGGLAAWVRARPLVVGAVAVAALLLTLVLGVGLGSVRVAPARDVRGHPSRACSGSISASPGPRRPRRSSGTCGCRASSPRCVIGCGAGGGGRDVPGPLAQPARRSVRARHRIGRGARARRSPSCCPSSSSSSSSDCCTAWRSSARWSSAWVVFRLGGTGGAGGLTRLLLTGYAVGSVLAALLTMAMYVSGVELRQIFSFLLGGLGGVVVGAAGWSRRR